MIGLLVTMVCIVVLFVIGMNALNNAVTGGGSSRQGTLRSMQDQLQLAALFQSMLAHAPDRGGRFPTPSDICGRGDRAEDVTANVFSAMVMAREVADPAQLVSANEFSGYVWPIEDYDYRLYDPAAGVYWDPKFRADLDDLSNVSYAHVPLFGERFDRHWASSLDATFPILGNRGPKDGVHDPASFTYGRNGVWGGHVVYGDGHVVFTGSFTPEGLYYERGGERRPDNLFAIEDGPGGRDAILSFTEGMAEEGPALQFD